MTDHVTDRTAVALRAAGPDDADEIAQLFTDEGYPAGPSDIVARLERFASPHSRVIVAEHDGAILGFIAVHALPRFEHDDRILRILALVVDAGRPRARRRAGADGRGRADRDRARAPRSSRSPPATTVPRRATCTSQLGYDATVAAYLRKKL